MIRNMYIDLISLYCQKSNFNNHARVQSLLNSLLPLGVPKPCCVPTKMAPLTTLILNELNNVALHTFQNMKVEECECR